MSDHHPISCDCGNVTGHLDASAWANRIICYCDNCQAFAEFLGRPDDILDTRGGSDIVQTAPRFVSFSQGHEHLACTRLSPRLLRWYASCCRTPIGNTPANRKLSFVGLVHNCLADADLDAAFGAPKMRVFTKFARGEPKPKGEMPMPDVARLAGRVAWARLRGHYRHGPFFDATGAPVATPVSAAAAPAP